MRTKNKTLRQTGAKREQQLRLAIKRLQSTAPPNSTNQITFAAVARAANVSTALIHNHYPKIAEMIRAVQGRNGCSARDAHREVLKAEREKSRALRDEVAALRNKLRMLASINETLIVENQGLRASLSGSKIVGLKSRRAL